MDTHTLGLWSASTSAAPAPLRGEWPADQLARVGRPGCGASKAPELLAHARTNVGRFEDEYAAVRDDQATLVDAFRRGRAEARRMEMLEPGIYGPPASAPGMPLDRPSAAPEPLPGESRAGQLARSSRRMSVVPEAPGILGLPVSEFEHFEDDLVKARDGQAESDAHRRQRAEHRRMEMHEAGTYWSLRSLAAKPAPVSCRRRSPGSSRAGRSRPGRRRATSTSRDGPPGRDEGDGEPVPPPEVTPSAKAELSNSLARKTEPYLHGVQLIAAGVDTLRLTVSDAVLAHWLRGHAAARREAKGDGLRVPIKGGAEAVAYRNGLVAVQVGRAGEWCEPPQALAPLSDLQQIAARICRAFFETFHVALTEPVAVARYDIAADVGFASSAVGLAFLDALSRVSIARHRVRSETAVGSDRLESVVWRTKREQHLKLYDTGARRGREPGRLLRLEVQLRDGPRRTVEQVVETAPREWTKWLSKLSGRSSGPVLVATYTEAINAIFTGAADGRFTNRTAQSLVGHVGRVTTSVPLTPQQLYESRRALRKHGFTVSEGTHEPLDIRPVLSVFAGADLDFFGGERGPSRGLQSGGDAA